MATKTRPGRRRELTSCSGRPKYADVGLRQTPGFSRRHFVQALPCPRFEGGRSRPFLAPIVARKKHMSRIVLYGFPRSTFVNVVRLVLEHKGVTYHFHDLEEEMGRPSHLNLHPFNRVPILGHGDFRVYETAAIIAYLDDVFHEQRLTPEDPQERARMNQWIGALN